MLDFPYKEKLKYVCQLYSYCNDTKKNLLTRLLENDGTHD